MWAKRYQNFCHGLQCKKPRVIPRYTIRVVHAVTVTTTRTTSTALVELKLLRHRVFHFGYILLEYAPIILRT